VAGDGVTWNRKDTSANTARGVRVNLFRFPPVTLSIYQPPLKPYRAFSLLVVCFVYNCCPWRIANYRLNTDTEPVYTHALYDFFGTQNTDIKQNLIFR
jgi:hypothetical protein